MSRLELASDRLKTALDSLDKVLKGATAEAAQAGESYRAFAY